MLAYRTFQEPIRSNMALLHNGRETVPFEAFLRFGKALKIAISENRDPYQNKRRDVAYSMRRKHISRVPIRLLDPRGMASFPSFRFHDWVHEFALQRQSQDPRDKVFAVHSLLPEQVRRDITIDYSARTADVFEAITRAYIKVEGPTRIMEIIDKLGNAHDNANGTPSWVPNYLYFQQPGSSTRAPWFSPDWPDWTEKKLEHWRRCVSLGKYWIEDEGRELEMFGYKIGTCTAQSNGFSKKFESGSFPQEGQYLDLVPKKFDEVRRYYRHCRDALNVRKEQIPSFTNTFGGPILGGPITIENLSLFLGGLEEFSSTALFEDADEFTLLILSGLGIIHSRRVLFEFEPSVSFVSDNPVPLELREEPYGIGVDDMQVGDEIFVLLGSESTYILRPRTGSNSGYTLVGSAFVGSLRDSEWLWDLIEKRSAKLEIISLF